MASLPPGGHGGILDSCRALAVSRGEGAGMGMMTTINVRGWGHVVVAGRESRRALAISHGKGAGRAEDHEHGTTERSGHRAEARMSGVDRGGNDHDPNASSQIGRALNKL